MALDGKGVARELQHLGVVERKAVALFVRNLENAGRFPGLARLREYHFLQLRAEDAPHDGRPAPFEHRLVDIELVGIDRALHHHFPQPVGRGDEHDVAKPGLRVEREEHPARALIAAHHLLHGCRQRGCAVAKSLVDAIGDGAVGVERGEHVPDRFEHVVHAADIEEGLLLPGERRFGQVFGRRRGAHGE